MIKRDCFITYGKFLDILGISCDTMYEDTNRHHGRKPKGTQTIPLNNNSNSEDTHNLQSTPSRQLSSQCQKLESISQLCQEFGVMLKLNTVVTKFNFNENIYPLINKIQPMRWKIFQVLPVEGENYGIGSNITQQNVIPLEITTNEFQNFCNRNIANLNDPTIAIIEDNDTMRSSYINIDENGCFLDSSTGQKTPTRSIFEVGLNTAVHDLLSSSGGGFDKVAFDKRGGYYPETWSRSSNPSSLTSK